MFLHHFVVSPPAPFNNAGGLADKASQPVQGLCRTELKKFCRQLGVWPYKETKLIARWQGRVIATSVPAISANLRNINSQVSCTLTDQRKGEGGTRCIFVCVYVCVCVSVCVCVCVRVCMHANACVRSIMFVLTMRWLWLSGSIEL